MIKSFYITFILVISFTSLFAQETENFLEFEMGEKLEIVKSLLLENNLDFICKSDDENNLVTIYPRDEYLIGKRYFTYSFSFFNEELYGIRIITESSNYLESLITTYNNYENYINPSDVEIYDWMIDNKFIRCRHEEQFFFYFVQDMNISRQIDEMYVFNE